MSDQNPYLSSPSGSGTYDSGEQSQQQPAYPQQQQQQFQQHGQQHGQQYGQQYAQQYGQQQGVPQQAWQGSPIPQQPQYQGVPQPQPSYQGQPPNGGYPYPNGGYPQQQGAYGMPPQGPGHQQPGGAPPKPKKKGGKGLYIGVGAVVVVCALIVGFVFSSGGNNAINDATGGSGSTQYGQLKVKWAVMGTAGKGKISTMAGTWLTQNVIADGRSDGIIAYALGNGAQKWNFQTPAGYTGCSMSMTPSSTGIGVYGYGASSTACDHLVGINVDSGQTLWTVNLDQGVSSTDTIGSVESNGNPPSVSGDILATPIAGGNVGAFDLSSGKELWHTTSSTSLTAPTCTPQGIQALQGSVYVFNSCTNYSNNTSYGELDKYPGQNAGTPTKLDVSSIPAPAAGGYDNVSLWKDDSTGYLFLLVGSSLFAYAPNATSPVKVDLSKYGTSVEAFSNDSSDGQMSQHGYAIYGHMLYLQTALASGDTNSLVAIDLTSGKQLWTKSYSSGSFTVLSADAAGVHTLVTKDNAWGSQLTTLAPADGSAKYGPGTQDARFMINSSNNMYLQNDYIIDVTPVVLSSSDPEIVLLTGASK